MVLGCSDSITGTGSELLKLEMTEFLQPFRVQGLGASSSQLSVRELGCPETQKS